MLVLKDVDDRFRMQLAFSINLQGSQDSSVLEALVEFVLHYES